MSIGAMGELSGASTLREGGGAMTGAAVEALRFGGAVSCSWKIGDTGLGAVVDGARRLPVIECVDREELYSGLTGDMMLEGGTEETVEDLDTLVVERGGFEDVR